MSHVDSTSPITHVSLCAGYGGIDLGLKRAIPSLRTIAFSEIEGFACANLVAKMEAGLLDAAPVWTDLKTFPWSEFHGRVDILSGGYPCQPFSAAGKRLGAEDPRHLWPFIAAGIALMRPAACFFENVEGHISLGLPDVIEDLGRLGYRTTWGVFSASEVGAPHQRKRVFILAYDQSLRIQGRWPSWIEESRPHARQALPLRGGDAGGSELADPAIGRRDRQHARSRSDVGQWATPQDIRPEVAHAGSCGTAQAWPSRPGEQQYAWEPPRVVADTLRKQSQRGRDAGELGSAASAEQGEAQQWERCGNSAGYQGEAGTLVNTEDRRQPRNQASSAEIGWRPTEFGLADGEGTIPNATHLRLEEQRPERTSRDLSSGCGEAMDDAASLRSAEPADGCGQAAPWADASSDQAMGNAPQRQDHGRESRDMGFEAGQGRCGDHAARSAGEVLGHASSQRCEQDSALRGQQQSSRIGQECGSGVAEAVGHANSQRPQERPRQRGSGIQGADADGGESAGGEIKPELGLLLDGSADGLGGPAVSGLSDQELAEICQWMGASTNRTDSLRLLGNGVVPATAERAFRVLVGELREHRP